MNVTDWQRQSVVLALAGALMAASFGLQSAARGQNFDEVEIETVEVATGVHMLVGAGGNMAVASGEDGVFLIDDQFAPLTEKIQAAIGKISAQPVRFVFNTHYHGDHTGGNENLGKAGATIVAHDNVRQRMSLKQFSKTFNRETPPYPPDALPVVTFNDRVTFHLNGDTLATRHFPHAHTDGDAVIHFVDADVLHIGDLYFNGMYPYIDTSGGGSVNGLIEAIRAILPMAGSATKIIPGHGELSKRDELAAYLEMLEGVRAAVQARIEEGLDRDATLAAKPTSQWDEAWGQGFMKPDLFTGILFDSLSADG